MMSSLLQLFHAQTDGQEDRGVLTGALHKFECEQKDYKTQLRVSKRYAKFFVSVGLYRHVGLVHGGKGARNLKFDTAP
jgi:hypothetical protein